MRTIYEDPAKAGLEWNGTDWVQVKFAMPITIADTAIPGANIVQGVMRGCCRARTQPNTLGSKFIKVVADVDAQNTGVLGFS